MNRKIAVLLLGSVLAVTGAVIKGTENANANLPSTNINNRSISISEKSNNLDIFAQNSSSYWGITYTNPDTGQELCYSSSRGWVPCPGQGDVIIIPQNAKCRGGESSDDFLNDCPKAKCELRDKVRDNLNGTNTTPPCNGLP